MSLDDQIRQIVAEEVAKLAKLPQSELLPVAEFCKLKNISRTLIWRAEKEGKLKLTRIGRKVFIRTDQFWK